MFIIKKIIILLGAVIFLNLQAQDVIILNDQQPSTSHGNASIGQSFTSPFNAEMTAISVRALFSNSQATLTIFATADGSGSSIYSQSNITLSANFSATNPQQIIALDTPVSITAGQVYSFILSSPSGLILYHNMSDVYAGGAMISNNVVSPATDLEFGIYGNQVTAIDVAAPRAIPTNTQWGLMSILLMLIIMSMLFFKRKEITDKAD